MKKTIVGFLAIILLIITLAGITNAFVPSKAKADTEFKTLVSLKKATSKKPISVHLEIKNTSEAPLELANFVFTFENYTDKTHFWGMAPSFRYVNNPLQLDKNKKISINLPLTDFKFIDTAGSLILTEQVNDLLEKQIDDWSVKISISTYEWFIRNPYASLDSDFPRNFQFEEE